MDAKRNVLRTGIIKRQEVVLGIYAEAVADGIEHIETAYVNTRIWEKDGSVWKGNNLVIQAVRERLGWLDVSKTIDRARLKALQAEAGQWSQVVLLGMGGSSLSAEVLSKVFGAQPGFPTLHVLDSTNPATHSHGRRLAGSAEDAVHRRQQIRHDGGDQRAVQVFLRPHGPAGRAVSSPSPTRRPRWQALAAERGFRDCFLNPPDIGGRYSALSYFGMVPAALLGLDLDALWTSVGNMMLACGPRVSGTYHPGIWLGAIMGVLAHEGRDKVSLITSPSIAGFGDWVEQLLAESTGKQEKRADPGGGRDGRQSARLRDRPVVHLPAGG